MELAPNVTQHSAPPPLPSGVTRRRTFSPPERRLRAAERWNVGVVRVQRQKEIIYSRPNWTKIKSSNCQMGVRSKDSGK